MHCIIFYYEGYVFYLGYYRPICIRWRVIIIQASEEFHPFTKMGTIIISRQPFYRWLARQEISGLNMITDNGVCRLVQFFLWRNCHLFIRKSSNNFIEYHLDINTCTDVKHFFHPDLVDWFRLGKKMIKILLNYDVISLDKMTDSINELPYMY